MSSYAVLMRHKKQNDREMQCWTSTEVYAVPKSHMCKCGATPTGLCPHPLKKE
jgi:hypothetical protein